MSELFNKGEAILFMKIGTHANEELARIIARKKREIQDAGFAMWGYGGNTCHPTTIVQPFAKAHSSPSQPILLCMQPMTSKHFADPIKADEYSIDGIEWKGVPQGIRVLGSRYALCVKGLKEVETSLPLGATRVATGNSKGRLGSDYVKGHVDKACLEIVDHVSDESVVAPIRFVAEIVEPYAVFLRN